MLADKRYCYPLTITDSASQYLIACDALATTKERLICRPPKNQSTKRMISIKARAPQSPGPTIPTVPVIATAAAEQQDDQDNDQDCAHLPPSLPIPDSDTTEPSLEN